MIHAALDRLEELLGSPKNLSLPRLSRGSHWIGSICLMEENEVYGYVTSSNVKILALIQREHVIPLQRRHEGDIRMLFVSYIRYQKVFDFFFVIVLSLFLITFFPLQI